MSEWKSGDSPEEDGTCVVTARRHSSSSSSSLISMVGCSSSFSLSSSSLSVSLPQFSPPDWAAALAAAQLRLLPRGGQGNGGGGVPLSHEGGGEGAASQRRLPPLWKVLAGNQGRKSLLLSFYSGLSPSEARAKKTIVFCLSHYYYYYVKYTFLVNWVFSVFPHSKIHETRMN